MKNYVMAAQNVLRDAVILETGHFICRFDTTGASIVMNVQLHVPAPRMLYPGSLQVLPIYQKMPGKNKY